MAEKYIIYTMGNEKINEEVQEILFEKGYRWFSDSDNDNEKKYELGPWEVLWINDDHFLSHSDQKYADREKTSRGLKELTFRQLCELPPAYDELDEIAEKLVKFIKDNWAIDKISFCDLWDKMKPLLGV